MKNIQVIDGAINSVYDIFAATDDEFLLIFPNDTNIAFIDEVLKRGPKKKLGPTFENLWKRPVRKAEANGIHGILFYELEIKKQFRPHTSLGFMTPLEYARRMRLLEEEPIIQ